MGARSFDHGGFLVAGKCIVHIQEHFDPLKGRENQYAWCEAHGRLNLLTAKGAPSKGKAHVFTSDTTALAAVKDYHEAANA